jgi:hypothetical protein
MVLNPEGTFGGLLESFILEVVLIQRPASEISTDSGTTEVNFGYRWPLGWTSMRTIEFECIMPSFDSRSDR